MPDVQVTTRAGGQQRMDQKVIEDFRGSLRGRLLMSDSTEYNEARAIWNAMIDRQPALIARCIQKSDVEQAVRFARDHDMTLAVRGGGHNIAGNAVCDGGLVIDLSPMKSVQVDAAGRMAQVAGGATLGDFDRTAQAHGLVAPLGINSTTGVAGLTLGGGFGWLSRRLGLTIDSLVSAEVVTASGEAVTASESENADLFWGIRGGGGNFGVVTSFNFRLHPVGPEVFSGLVIHPLDHARDVLHFYRDFVAMAGEEFVCWFVMRKAPPLPAIPAQWHGKEILALAMCYSGDPEEGERVARPLRTFGQPIADMVGRNPYSGWQTALDPLLTPGARNYWKSHDFLELSDGLIDVILDHAHRLPDPQTEIAFAQLGGAVARVPPEATAYTHRNAEYLINVHGRWSDKEKDEACVGWVRSLFNACAPFATGGVYVNFLTQEEGGRIKSAYGKNYDRLVQLKNKFDPSNLFRLNQNIQPTV